LIFPVGSAAAAFVDTPPNEHPEVEGILLSIKLDELGQPTAGVLRFLEGRKFWRTSLFSLVGAVVTAVEKVETPEKDDDKDN